MEVLTIEHSAFQQLISKIEAMDEFIRKAKLEQQSSLDDDWVDGQAVCEYLCICDKTLQRLRSAGKITYSNIGATKASVLGVFEPITAILVGTLVFGEALTTNIVVGIFIAIVAVTFMIITTKR